MTPTLALVLYALVTMTALSIEIFYTYATQGFGFGFSSNRPLVEKSPLGKRVQKAYENQAESAAYIVPVLAAAALVGLDSPDILLACAIIVVGRAAYVPLYYTGVTFIRILAFTPASLGSLYVAVNVILALMAS